MIREGLIKSVRKEGRKEGRDGTVSARFAGFGKGEEEGAGGGGGGEERKE